MSVHNEVNMATKRTPADPARVSQAQQRHLMERLRNSRWNHVGREEREPKKVAAARRVLAAWGDAKKKRDQRRVARDERMRTEAESAIHFGTPERALAAVERFERRDDVKGKPKARRRPPARVHLPGRDLPPVVAQR